MACLSSAELKALPESERMARIMAGFRRKETGSFAGNYTSGNDLGSNASGAYQIVNSTWVAWLKEFGLSGPARAASASKQLQDQVAYLKLNQIYKRYDGDIFKMGVYWFYPRANVEPVWLDRVPVDKNGRPTNNPTPRQYANDVVKYVLCGPDGGDLAYVPFPTIQWKNLPICLGDDGDQVVKLNNIFGITTSSTRFGTALQFKIVRFQMDNGLPYTGCFGEAEAALVAEDIIFDEQGDPSVVTDLVKVPGGAVNQRIQTGLPEATVKVWKEVVAVFGGRITALGAWGDASHQATGSCHNSGRALDISCNKANGDIISQWLVDNRQRLGITLVIWYKKKASARTKWRFVEYFGEKDHRDHVHASIQCNG